MNCSEGNEKMDGDSCDFTSPSIRTIDELDPGFRGLGLHAYIWHGDDLPRRVGGPPPGYITDTYMTQWIRGKDAAGYMSFGPYFNPTTVGSLLRVKWIMEIRDRGGANEDVLTVDCVDQSGGVDIFPPTTFKVSQFPANSDGFIIFSPNRNYSIDAGMNIETRVKAHGGASLKLHQIRYDIHYI